MEEFEEILIQHAKKYPLMTPQDCMKLLYQNTFGPEHAVSDPEQSLGRLIMEYEETEADENCELFTPIGNGLCRLELAKAKTLYSPEEVNDWFVSTANSSRGSLAVFMHKIKVFRLNYKAYGFRFSEDETAEFMAKYRSQAYPPVHHSDIYREAYHPHYRVMYLNRWELHDAEKYLKDLI